MPAIEVTFMNRPDRFIECIWKDPVTGKQRTRSTGTNKQRDAERFRAKLEFELNNEGELDLENSAWSAAADRYENENLASRAPKTLAKWRGTRAKLETHINPQSVAVLTASVISRLQTALRAEGLAESTIKGHLAHLKAALHWFARLGYIKKVPTIDMPKRIETMRGRPITTEEFERMLTKLDDPAIIPTHLASGWKHLFTGLWLSGLRLGEGLELRWNTGGLAVIVSATPTGFPVRLKIETNRDKSTEFRILPLAPDFQKFLLQTPPADRKGRVFQPIVPHQLGDMRLDTCSKFIERVGRKAQVLEQETPAKERGEPSKKKFASAHSFRRAFGTRWAKAGLSLLELKTLMRHADSKTTEKYYLEINARSVEESLDRLQPPACTLPPTKKETANGSQT